MSVMGLGKPKHPIKRMASSFSHIIKDILRSQRFNLLALGHPPLYCMVQNQRLMKAEHLG